ncbi:MAG: hypothetical protein HY320_05100 [Armatimonadetes bacterium]|nr:hypothetical protein [Armatimonadota bacterium]
MRRMAWLAALALAAAVVPSSGTAAPPLKIRHREFQDRVLPLLSRTDDQANPLLALWIPPELVTYIVSADRIDPSPANYLAMRFFQRSILIYLRPPEGEQMEGWERLRERARVRDARGREYPPLPPPRRLASAFCDANPEGTQALLFPRQTPEGDPLTAGGALELIVRDVGGVQERTYRWETPIRYPLAAQNLLKSLRQQQREAVRAQVISPEERVRAALPWLCDVVHVRNNWLMLAWCTRRWWKAALSATSETSEENRGALREILERSTLLVLFGMESASASDLRQIAQHAVLTDAEGLSHPAAEPPLPIQALLRETLAGDAISGDLPAWVLFFRDAPPMHDAHGARLMLEPEGGQPACTIKWQRPPAVPRSVGRLLGWER